MKQFFVYILASRSGVLYVGMTSDLLPRMAEHRQKVHPGFTERYDVDRLVYYKSAPDFWSAVAEEKKIKSWRRAKKIALIDSMNPEWRDLAAEWFEEPASANDHRSWHEEIPRRDAMLTHPVPRSE
jgi:putative endonuclease